jgi:pimeloyl-ACP methyl ester carboxylesterase
MSATGRVARSVGVAAGVAAGVAGAAYGAQLAVARNLRRRPDPDSGTIGRLRFDEERRLPSHDGGSIYVISRGSGPTIVLSHGVTIDSRVWVKQLALLPERGMHVVAYDHRGHGQSSVGETGHSVENLSADVRTVLEGLDLRDVLLVGHSMGGLAAQAFVLGHPEIARVRVRGLVLLSTFARTPLAALSSRTPSARNPVARASGWVDLAGLMRRPQLGTMLARLGFGRDPLASHVELTRLMLSQCEQDASRAAILPLLGLDLTAELEHLTIPAVVVCGTADRLTPPFEARRLARHIPGARLHLLDGGGHMLMLERTEELHHLLFDFARDVGLPVDALDAVG